MWIDHPLYAPRAIFFVAIGDFWLQMVRMKSVTIRLTEQEFELLRRIKNAGFSSLAEVIRCAALSMARSTKPKSAA